FFSTRRTGEILARINDAIKIRIAISATTLSIIVDSILVLAVSALMLTMNWRVTLLSIGAVPAVATAICLLSRPLKRHQRAAMAIGAEIEAQVVETIGGMQSVKSLRAEPSVGVRTEARFHEMLDTAMRAQMLIVHTSTLTTAAAGLSSLSLL